ncbi:MAG: ribonuclease HI [Lactobacillales bacterium]|jgi:ribonuclease HI|nr:ribonuclease HI [Lactobacillales bacterium]
MQKHNKLKNVTLYTDGACSGNPGIGGWAALLSYKGKTKQISGHALETTNNKMELTAAIEGLSLIREKCAVDLYTDSKYVLEGAEKWMPAWKNNKWRKSDNKPVANMELWQKLDVLLQKHDVVWHWVKGHAGHPQNELVDALAVAEYEKLRG